MSERSFYRQSAWMMFATVAQGALMWAVHFFAKVIPQTEYAAFGALLALTMLVPAMPLQMVFAQQTAALLAAGRRKELARMIRMGWLGSFLLWAVVAAVMLGFQRTLVAGWGLSNPAALWSALLTGLGCIWLPIVFGVLQGAQDFRWLGWSMIFNSVGRLGMGALLVLALGGQAAGMMTAAAIGYGLAFGVGALATRRLWTGPGAPFDLKAIVRQVVPLGLGFLACQIVFTSDTLLVKAWFPGDPTASYVAAGTLSRAVIWLVMPLAIVMFPKLVHSTVRAEKTDVMAVTLIGTGLLAACGAVGLWVLGPWAVRLVYKPDYIELTTRLLPWYAAAMVPLALANVLANSLLARGQFRVVPWIMALAVGYPITLFFFHGSMIAVLHVLTLFCTLLFLVCAWFTWGGKKTENQSVSQ